MSSNLTAISSTFHKYYTRVASTIKKASIGDTSLVRTDLGPMMAVITDFLASTTSVDRNQVLHAITEEWLQINGNPSNVKQEAIAFDERMSFYAQFIRGKSPYALYWSEAPYNEMDSITRCVLAFFDLHHNPLLKEDYDTLILQIYPHPKVLEYVIAIVLPCLEMIKDYSMELPSIFSQLGSQPAPSEKKESATQSVPAEKQKDETIVKSAISFTPQYQGNIPVIIENITLKKDNSTGSLVAHCKFKSAAANPIVAIKLEVSCFNVWQEHLHDVQHFEYLDLNMSRKAPNGHTLLIPLSDSSTRIVKISFLQVAFDNGTIIKRTKDCVSIPEQEPIDAHFSSKEIAQEYRTKTSRSSKYIPKICDEFWCCTCGEINRIDESCCHSCKLTRQKAVDALNVSLLQEAIDQRRRVEEERRRETERKFLLEKQEFERIEEERRREVERQRAIEAVEAKKKARNRAITSAVLIGIILLIILITRVIIPAIEYKKAENSLLAGSYDLAYAQFIDLGKYSDSESMAKEALYQKAGYLFDNGSILEAAELYASLSYSDSSALGQEAYYIYAGMLAEEGFFHEAYLTYMNNVADETYKDTKALANSAEYNYALYLFEDEQYEDAIVAFERVIAFKDSADYIAEAKYLLATDLFSRSEYSDACNIFSELKDYKDSADLYSESTYLWAMSEFDQGSYESAHELFSSLKDYKDCVEMSNESLYQHAHALLTSRNFVDAAAIFESLGKYKDSQKQTTAASYEHGLQCMSNREFVEAVKVFEELGRYKDSYNQYLSAMYAYVKANTYKPYTSHVHDYLEILVKKGYKDSSALYKDMYAWSVKLVAVNTDPSDYTTRETTVSKYTSHLHFHFKLEGGPPGEKITMYHTTSWPDGNISRSSWTWDNKSRGNTFGVKWDDYLYNSAEDEPAGKLTIKIYNKANGQYIGEASVYVK